MPGNDGFLLCYYESVLNSIPSGTLALNSELVIASMNPAAERILGLSTEECLGFPLPRLLDPALGSDDAGVLETGLSTVLRNRIPFVHELGMAGRAMEFKASALVDSPGGVMGVVLLVEDITERKAMVEMLRRASLTDDLTGLSNRRGFLLRAEQQLKTAGRLKRRGLLLYADMDNLKPINDAWGHAQGDQALIDIAAVLKEITRETDIVARVGGDEFAVLTLGAPERSAPYLLARLERNLEAYNAGDGRLYKLALSVGVAHYDPEAPCSVADLLDQADTSMYQQKQSRY